MRIPKNLHIIWVGPQPAPEPCIRAWQTLNPSWTFRLWGNGDVANGEWRLKRLIDWAMSNRKYSVVSDLMRYEILFNLGGFYADADSTALRPLDDELFQTDFLACWSGESYTPGLVANGFLAAAPGNPVLRDMIEELSAIEKWPKSWRWRKLKFKPVSAAQVSGPNLLTRHLHEARGVTILPSGLFIPEHYEGSNPQPVPPYATHHWGSMQKSRGLKNPKVHGTQAYSAPVAKREHALPAAVAHLN